MRFTFIDSFLSTQSQDQYEIQRSLTILTYWYKKKKKRKARFLSLCTIDIFGQIILCFVRCPIGWKIAVSLVSSHQKLVAYFAPNVTFKNVSRHCQIFPQYKIVHS